MSESAKYKLTMWIIAPILQVAAFCFCFFLKGNYNLYGTAEALINSSIINALFFLLYVVGSFGAFDMVTYGTYTVAHYANPSREKKKKYETYTDYVENRRARGKRLGIYFLPWLVFIGLTAIAGMICMGVFQANYLG